MNEYMNLGDLIDETGKLVIPEGMTVIEDDAFFRTPELTAIEIPGSVTEIGEGAFMQCESLASIVVSPDNKYYKSVDNCCLSKDGRRLIFGCKNSIIPEGVTEICCAAFSGCAGLTSVEIPESVNTVGGLCFYGCSGLSSIIVSENNAGFVSVNNCCLTKDKETLVFGCKDSIIPEGVKTIGGFAFRNCTGLTSIEIPDSVTKIDDCAFSGCSGLTSVKLPSGKIEIGDQAFGDCAGLTSIEIPDGATKVGTFAFIDCHGLISVVIQGSATEIKHGAFSCCTGLTSIEIPDSLADSIADVFGSIDKITSITIRVTEKLPDRAKNVLRIADLSNPSVITLKVPAGCGEAYRQHPDFGGKFREILEVPNN